MFVSVFLRKNEQELGVNISKGKWPKEGNQSNLAVIKPLIIKKKIIMTLTPKREYNCKRIILSFVGL